jgi:hypothetical protein
MIDERKETDDVSGAAAPLAGEGEEGDAQETALALADEPTAEPTATADPPPVVAELAAACVRFVATRYGIHLDFAPETLSLVDQWVKDARLELKDNPSLAELVQGAAGAYLGEVIRRAFGATWSVQGEHSEWRLMLSTVYCAFNPIGMAREALLQGEAEGWHAHFELDPGEREEIEARLAALGEVDEEEFYAPSTRFDTVHMIVDALREKARSSGLADVRFGGEDYEGV